MSFSCGTAQHVYPTGLLTFQYNLWACFLTPSLPLSCCPFVFIFSWAPICFSADVRPKLTLLRTLIPFTHTHAPTHTLIYTYTHTHTLTPALPLCALCICLHIHQFFAWLLLWTVHRSLWSLPSPAPLSQLRTFCGYWRQIVCLFLGFLCDSGQSQQSVSRRPLNAFSFNALCVRHLARQVHNCHYAYAVWSRGRMAFLACTFPQYAYAEIYTRSIMYVCECVANRLRTNRWKFFLSLCFVRVIKHCSLCKTNRKQGLAQMHK